MLDCVNFTVYRHGVDISLVMFTKMESYACQLSPLYNLCLQYHGCLLATVHTNCTHIVTKRITLTVGI